MEDPLSVEGAEEDAKTRMVPATRFQCKRGRFGKDERDLMPKLTSGKGTKREEVADPIAD